MENPKKTYANHGWLPSVSVEEEAENEGHYDFEDPLYADRKREVKEKYEEGADCAK